MNASIRRYFDKLERVCRPYEAVWGGKKGASVMDQYNQMLVRVDGFQAPFVTLPKEQQKDYLKRSISEGV